MKPRPTPWSVLQGDSVAQDRISPDGLRYLSKQLGSPCSSQGIGTCVMRSCFFCGTHKGPSQRRTQKVMGKTQLVCDPLCASNPRSRSTSARVNNDPIESDKRNP